MRIYVSISLILLALGLSGCEQEADLAEFFSEQCAEAAHVPLGALNASSTCNGGPLLFAFRNARGLTAVQVRTLVDLMQARGFDFDVQESGTGRTALMLAATHEDPRWLINFRRVSKHPDLRDRDGRTFAHYAAENAAFRGGAVAFAGTDLEARDRGGRTPAQLAYGRGNYDVAWMLFKAGASPEFLNRSHEDIDPSFLMNDGIEGNLSILNQLPQMLSARFEPGPNIKAGSLGDFAAIRCLPGLATYLAANGALGTRAIACAADKVVAVRPQLIDGLAHPNVRNRLLSDQGGMHAWINPGTRNKMGQNFAHIYFYSTPSAEYDRDWNLSSGGFAKFLDLASSHGWLTQADAVGMTPAFHWLASPARRADQGFFARRTARANWSALLARVTDRNARTANGDTLLSFAVLTGQLGLVQATLEGAPELKNQRDTKNMQGLSPLDLAHDHSLWDIYGYLRKI